MADYSTAAANAADALDASEIIEEYEIGPRGRRVKRGKPADQLAAALILEGIAARRGGKAIFTLAKPVNPT